MKDTKMGTHAGSRIATRITLGFASVLFLTVALGLFAFMRMLTIRQSANEIQSNVIPWVQSLEREQERAYHALALLLYHGQSTDAKEREDLETQVDKLRQLNSENLESVAGLASTPEEAALYGDVKADRADFWTVLEDARTASRSGVVAGDAQAGQQLAAHLKATSQKYVADLQRLVDLHRNDRNEGLTLIGSSAGSANTGILLFILLSIAITVVVNALIVNSMAAPLRRTVAALDLVAAGDLTPTVGVHTSDELGQMAQALDAALTMLRSTLKEVAESANTSNNASQQLAASAEEIANGAQQQAASLEETSASLEQITAAVKLTAENARQASQLATGCRESAEKGQEVVSKAVGAMAEINTASAKISDIISTINEIAFQTNLLAVNAAVEAARAGDEGRGFAVVAAEVRSLAQRSADASKEIRVLIEDTLKKVEKGCELVNHSGATLEGIVGSVKRVTEIVAQIAAASTEQSTGVAQVNFAVTQMDQITHSNSAQTEELASAAQAFAQQAARLMQLVNRFKLQEGHLPLQVDGSGLASNAALLVGHEDLRRQAARSSARLAGGKFAGAVPNRGNRRASSAVLAGSGAVRADDGSFEEF